MTLLILIILISIALSLSQITRNTRRPIYALPPAKWDDETWQMRYNQKLKRR